MIKLFNLRFALFVYSLRIILYVVYFLVNVILSVWLFFSAICLELLELLRELGVLQVEVILHDNDNSNSTATTTTTTTNNNNDNKIMISVKAKRP